MNTGEITGAVRDPSGAALPGATIIAEQTATGLKFTTTSNSAGQYLLPGLAIGSYSLTASARNFKQSILPALDLHLGVDFRYDFTLQLGDSTELLTVVQTRAQRSLTSRPARRSGPSWCCQLQLALKLVF